MQYYHKRNNDAALRYYTMFCEAEPQYLPNNDFDRDAMDYFVHRSRYPASTQEAKAQIARIYLQMGDVQRAEIAAEEKRAEYFRQQAETIHTYTKTATSAIMLPIRMMGRKAVELAQPTQQEEDGWKKAVMDTVGGCGNGIMSIAKGFTEV